MEQKVRYLKLNQYVCQAISFIRTVAFYKRSSYARTVSYVRRIYTFFVIYDRSCRARIVPSILHFTQI